MFSPCDNRVSEIIPSHSKRAVLGYTLRGYSFCAQNVVANIDLFGQTIALLFPGKILKSIDCRSIYLAANKTGALDQKNARAGF